MPQINRVLLDDLALKPQIVNALSLNGIYSVEHLLNTSPSQIYNLPGIGKSHVYRYLVNYKFEKEKYLISVQQNIYH
jgi:predicted transcriptional regulator YheO